MPEKITSVAGLKKAIGKLEIDPEFGYGDATHNQVLRDCLKLINGFEAGLKERLKHFENAYAPPPYKLSLTLDARIDELRRILEDTATGNDDKELEKRCEIAVKEVVEDSRKRRAKSSKKAGKGRGKNGRGG